jgi:hypothetical protein
VLIWMQGGDGVGVSTETVHGYMHCVCVPLGVVSTLITHF